MYSEDEITDREIEMIIKEWNESSEEDKERMREKEQHEIDVAMKRAIKKGKM